MPFSSLIGQDRARGALRSALARATLHHAYLFGGPAGVGKATLARLVAQAANCEGGPLLAPPEGEVGTGGGKPAARDPCERCGPCRKIARGTHPDVLLVSEERVMARAGRYEPKAGRTPSRDIVVDQVRDLIDGALALKRFEGRWRFVILDPADAMNVQAQNALLKTLEEPPEQTTLVLVSAKPELLLPTVRSRCAQVAFAPLDPAVVAERLRAEGRSAEEARLAASLSGGSLGWALAQDPRTLAAREAAVAAAALLDPDDAASWIAFARDRGEDRESARECLELLEVYLRDVLVAQAGSPVGLALEDLAPRSRAAAAALAPEEVLRRLEGVRAASAALKQNAAPVLALEHMLIGWFHGAR